MRCVRTANYEQTTFSREEGGVVTFEPSPMRVSAAQGFGAGGV